MKKAKGSLRAAALLAAVLTAGMPLAAGTGFFAAPLTVFAEETPVKGENDSFYYEKYSDHVLITFTKSYSVSSVVIPSTIDGLPVTEIGIYAFQSCECSSLTLPDTLEIIGKYSFGFCKKLTSVTIPDSIKKIDLKAFEGCSSLREVNLPDRLVEIGELVFIDTPWLENLRKQDPLVIVNGALIDGQTCTGEVKIPSGVKYISGSAFARNKNITSVTVPSSVKVINENTFFMCSGLTSAELKGCTSLGYGVFSYCDKLTDVKLSGKLQTIDYYTFSDNTATATITFYGSQATWNQVKKPDSDAFLQRAKYVFDESHQDDDDEVIGDINKDGKCDAADAALLCDWLICEPGTVLADWKAGDLTKDGKLDARDLSLLKQIILKNRREKPSY